MTAHPSEPVWDVFGRLTTEFYAAGRPDGAHIGEGWFARELAGVLGDELPAIVFTSEAVTADTRAALGAVNFWTAPVIEPLMRCVRSPARGDRPFRVSPAASRREIDVAVSLTAEAHHVEPDLLVDTIEVAALTERVHVWLAWEGEEAVSALWLGRTAHTIGVMEMMTPERHQRRGAGRCLLTAALADSWTPDTQDAVLLSTSVGRRLYESVGFVAVDEARTCFRGADQEVLDAIGQPGEGDPAP